MNQNPFVAAALALLIFVGGFFVGYLSADTTEEVVADASSGVGNAMRNLTTDEGDEAARNVENPDGVAFTVNIENIPEAQRAFLRTMGIEGNEIVVTNAMLACAEAKVGTGRMTEIQNGAVPSMSEGLQLVACYE